MVPGARLGFRVEGDQIVVSWRGRDIQYTQIADLPPYLGLHYELAALGDGNLQSDGIRARELRRFLGDDFGAAVEDPDAWIRDRLPPHVESWTLRRKGETPEEQESRMLNFFITGRKIP